MVDRLSIKNYKSIKSINIKPKRVNVFIGEHNTGKSNILEALSLFSVNALDQSNFYELFRFKTISDLFYDFDVTSPIEIKTNDLNAMIRYGGDPQDSIRNHFEGIISPDETLFKNKSSSLYNVKVQYEFTFFDISHKGEINPRNTSSSKWRTYIFRKQKYFQNNYRPFVNPPFGENIPSLLISNKHLKEIVSGIFKAKGFRLMMKPTEGDINMAKDVNDELYAYPYYSISETLQRIVFYQLIIESNKNSILILDEPESNTFPLYTKQLAELIALNKENQYFLSTHNPYLLGSLLEKTPLDELAVYLTRMEDYKTIVEEVKNEKLSELMSMGIDFYFNLDKLSSR